MPSKQRRCSPEVTTASIFHFFCFDFSRSSEPLVPPVSSSSLCPAFTHSPRFLRLYRSAQVLLVIAESGLDRNVLNYLHRKSSIHGAIAGIVDSMEDDETECTTVIDIWNVIRFLLQNSNSSDVLYEDASNCDIYPVLKKSIFWLNSHQRREEEHLKELLDVVEAMVYIGITELAPSFNQERNEDELKEMQTLSGPKVRNIEAFEVLHNAFMDATDSDLQDQILEKILCVFAAHPINYFIVLPLHTLAHMVEHIPKYDEKIRRGVLQVLEYLQFTTSTPNHHKWG
eukprot:TRINITY_DN3174_c0_g1_i2.p1 TRINITY_DN3174_c0_g1~~TRINITY_DN3174_c0_g1_i2.p1  ORF type:complete len:285 (+),score=37.38 TRINITY_DN3174_c0_g1_i2:243-1097(+)